MSPHRSSIAPAWLLAIAVGIAGCAPLPPLDGRTASYALQDTATTPLGQAVAPEAARHPGLTGIEPIADGRVALGMRLALLRAATRSIDIQTFIWHADNSGTLLYEEVLRAAERGVRVRLLLDDVNMRGPGSGLRPARRRAQHPAQALQPVHEPRLARARLPRRLRAPEPAHAQQVVHGRQPGGDRRRPQPRRRVLRGRRGGRASPTSTSSPSARRCGRSRPSSTSTGTAARPIRRGSSSIASRRSAGPSSRRGREPSPRARRRAPTPKPSAAPPRHRPCWSGDCRSNGRPHRSSTTIPRRPWTSTTRPTCSCCRSSSSSSARR